MPDGSKKAQGFTTKISCVHTENWAEKKEDSWFTYELLAEDPKTHARAGIFHTPHGDIPTPIFMPVGTKATVKGLMTDTVRDLGAKLFWQIRTICLSAQEMSWLHRWVACMTLCSGMDQF